MSAVARLVAPLAVAAVLFCLPGAAFAQTGTVAGQVKDSNGGALPGVTVEVSSPQLIEKTRVTTTDANGRYQIAALPVGKYEVKFTLQGFSTVVRPNVEMSSDFTAPVNVEMKVGQVSQTVDVRGDAPTVDVNNARVLYTFQGADIADLPTQRDVPSILNLVPSLVTSSVRGTCSGGIGYYCNGTVPLFNSHASMNDVDGQQQGRILVDGMSINMGRAATGINENVGMANGLVLNTADAQEVSFTLSGSLGESETGGASINLVPRTGGNRYAGSYFTSYTRTSFFDRNRDTRLTWSPTNPNSQPANQNYKYDYDVNGNFGGPVMKDRIWFYLQARTRGKESYPFDGQGDVPGYLNLHAGDFAANYLPDRDNGYVTYSSKWRSASARITVQATPKNKLNVYWDEQDSCTNPCDGMSRPNNTPEAHYSIVSRPNRLMQLSWTNPFTNQILLEAGISIVPTHTDTTHHRYVRNERQNPRICETGSTVGRDAFANGLPSSTISTSYFGIYACNIFTPGTMNSGSINDTPFAGLGQLYTMINDDTYRSRASASYITGSHNAKFGFEGAYYSEKLRNEANDMRMSYYYETPATTGLTWNATTRTGNCLMATAADPYSCGNMNLYYASEDPGNRIYRRPKPMAFQYSTGVAESDETVWFGALYLQDQWTLNRFTLNGAVRWDHSESSYGTTCFGPDLYVPTQAIVLANGTTVAGAQPSGSWCSEPAHGVTYNDITPRWGVAWDVFGNGKTAIKWNMGKYLGAAGLSGLYTNFNDARRSVNALTRGWDDINGNRLAECDPNNWLAHTSAQGDFCGAMITAGTTNPSTNYARFGRPPTDAALQEFAAANSTCGIQNQALSHQLYCGSDYTDNLINADGSISSQTIPGAGQNLISGWGKRRYEWQFGLGIQHELLPRLSVEVTYNRRVYGNQTDTDTLNQGCDYFGPLQAQIDWHSCPNAWMTYNDITGHRDFYRFTVPADPRLPDGGGYTIAGLNNQKANGALPLNNTAVRFADGTTATGTGAITLVRQELGYSWNGVDTNWVLRARGGLRISGGTSTGRAVRNTCYIDADTPNVTGRVGHGIGYGGGCMVYRPYQTNIRANASYTIPVVDVLTGVVFQYRPGNEISANLAVNSAWVQWEDPAVAQKRAGLPFNGAVAGSQTANVNLLDFGDMYGEGTRQTDLNFSKNVRFGRRRLNFGVNIYNLFNSDSATSYQNTYRVFQTPDGRWTDDDPATPEEEVNDWMRVTGVTTPRFLRFTVQFDF